MFYPNRDVCSSFATFVNRADRVDEPTWKTAPLDQQMYVDITSCMLSLAKVIAHSPHYVFDIIVDGLYQSS